MEQFGNKPLGAEKQPLVIFCSFPSLQVIMMLLNFNLIIYLSDEFFSFLVLLCVASDLKIYLIIELVFGDKLHN